MAKTMLAVFLVVGVAGACASPRVSYSVNERLDPFDGYERQRTSGNYLELDHLLDTNMIELNFQRFINADADTIYSAIVEYRSEEWLFIPEGESLVLLLEGERMGLTGEGSHNAREVLYGGRVSETAFYDLTVEQLAQLASARRISVKISGSRGFIERDLQAANLEHIRKFVADFVPGPAQPN